jgi:hypothetical protein
MREAWLTDRLKPEVLPENWRKFVCDMLGAQAIGQAKVSLHLKKQRQLIVTNVLCDHAKKHDVVTAAIAINESFQLCFAPRRGQELLRDEENHSTGRNNSFLNSGDNCLSVLNVDFVITHWQSFVIEIWDQILHKWLVVGRVAQKYG